MKYVSFENLDFLEIFKFYYPLTHSIYWAPYPWYFDPPTHGILTTLTMVYWPPYPWYIDPLTHGISTPLTMVFRPPTHGILNPLPMVYQPPYPWYIDPLSMVYWPPYPWHIDLPTHGISTPQPMVFWPPCSWNIDPPTYGISNPLLWYYELSFGKNEGGFKIQWQKIYPRVKIPYGKLNPGSQYHI